MTVCDLGGLPCWNQFLATNSLPIHAALVRHLAYSAACHVVGEGQHRHVGIKPGNVTVMTSLPLNSCCMYGRHITIITSPPIPVFMLSQASCPLVPAPDMRLIVSFLSYSWKESEWAKCWTIHSFKALVADIMLYCGSYSQRRNHKNQSRFTECKASGAPGVWRSRGSCLLYPVDNPVLFLTAVHLATFESHWKRECMCRFDRPQGCWRTQHQFSSKGLNLWPSSFLNHWVLGLFVKVEVFLLLQPFRLLAASLGKTAKECISTFNFDKKDPKLMSNPTQ